MAICIVKDMNQLMKSSSNIVDVYRVDSKKIVNLIKTRGLSYFSEKYRGSYMFGIDVEEATDFYAYSPNKYLDIPFTRHEKKGDKGSPVLFKKGLHQFTKKDVNEFLKYCKYENDQNRFLNENLIAETSRSPSSLANQIYITASKTNLYVMTHFNFGSYGLQSHDKAKSKSEFEYSIMKIDDIKQVFAATTGGAKNPIYVDIFMKLIKSIIAMSTSINAAGIQTKIPGDASGRFLLLESGADSTTDPKMFSKLLDDKDQLIDFLKDKLPAYDASLDNQKMSRIIASVKSGDSNYASLRIAIKRESSSDQLYSGLMGYHNFFGFYHFVTKLSGYDASMTQTRKASQVDLTSKKVESTNISYAVDGGAYTAGSTPAEFNISEQDLISIVNNLVSSGDLDRSKDLVMVLNYKYKDDGTVKRYSLNTVSGKGAVANKKLAVTLKVQIERTGAISVVTGNKPKTLKIKIPEASLSESFYKEFARILKKSVRNSF